MIETRKCKLCKKDTGLRKFDTIEFGTWNHDWEDWANGKMWVICKECKKKLQDYIKDMASTTQTQPKKSEEQNG